MKQIIDEILDHEGWPKYTNNPNDRGGPTKGGITLKTLSDHRGYECTAADVEALEESEAREIYSIKYVERPKFDRIADPYLQHQVVDCGVLSGQHRAALMLQEAANDARGDTFMDKISEDGSVGPQTIERVNSLDPARVGIALARRRLRFLGRIVARDPSQSVFISGWINRATDFLFAEVNRDA